MSISQEEKKILLQPYEYILKCSGKKVRSKLIQAFNYWLQVPDEQIRTVSEIVEMLHNSSLMIDDIEDNSVLRRGIPVAHSIFGIASTINSANYVYFLALDKVIKELPQEVVPEAVKIFTEKLLELHHGQGMDIYWRDNHVCPTEDQYLEMIQKKTGGLFGLGVGLLQLFSKEDRDFGNLIRLLGTFFQIRDDFLNLKSEEYAQNKSFCEDLTEGKFSFPIIHAIRSDPNDPTLINVVRQKTTDVDIKKFAVKLMDEKGSFEYTSSVLTKLAQESRNEVSQLGGNPLLSAVIDGLAIA